MNLTEFWKNPKRKSLLPCILLALAAGVLLLLLPEGSTAVTDTASPTELYREALEAEVEALIGEMEGVNSCTVVLTLSYGYEYLYATDQHVVQHANGKDVEKNLVLAKFCDFQDLLKYLLADFFLLLLFPLLFLFHDLYLKFCFC